MWIQHPLPKRNSGKEYQGPKIAIKKTDTAHQIKTELHNRAEPVDLRATKRRLNKEKLT